MKKLGILLYLGAVSFILGACASSTIPYQADIRVASLDPIPLGTVDAGIIRLFSSKVELMQVPLVYNPKTDAVTLEFRVQTTRYRQFWTRRMRETFIRALAEYEEDYTAHELPQGSVNKTARAYATMRGKAEWWLFAITTEYQGFPYMDLGYRFVTVAGEDGSKRRSPYFTVSQRKAKDIREQVPNKRAESLNIVLYFTRTMAQDLAAYFDEELLRGVIPNQYRTTTTIQDDYTETPPAAEVQDDYLETPPAARAGGSPKESLPLEEFEESGAAIPEEEY
jgi:hypothetical protein